MPKPLRVAVIGCGVIAPTHLDAFQRLEGVEVAAVCDVIEERARRRAEEFSVPRVAVDYQELLADPTIDALSICTDHASHAPIAAEALEAGKHILIEKALAASKEGLDRIVAAEAAHPDLVVSGIFQHRFDGAMIYMKELMDTGALGDLLSVGASLRCLRTPEYYRADQWRGTWAEEGGSLLINQAIHFLDLCAWLNGGVRSVMGEYANVTHQDTIETEDTAVAAFVYRNGVLGSFEATSSSHIRWEPTVNVHGAAGSVELRKGVPIKIEFDDEAMAETVRARFAAIEEEKQGAGKAYYGPSHPRQIADFVEAIRAGRKPVVTAASARHTVDVVLAIYESHRTGRRVTL